MKNKDYIAATKALVDWLESQKIKPEDAVRVLTMTLVAFIRVVAMRAGKDAKDGGKIIAKIIKESLV